MRVKRLTTWLVLGIAVALAYEARRRRGAPRRRGVPAEDGAGATPADVDRSSLGRGDLTGELFVEAISEWDLGAEALIDPNVSVDLNGEHVPPAADRWLPDDDHAQAEGENWLEHLEAQAAEQGPEPERALDVVDDSDHHPGHHKTATSDTPVADHGSGGPRGL